MSRLRAPGIEALGASAQRPAPPILLCAATPWESRPLAQSLALTSHAAGRWHGLLKNRPVRLVETGMGAAPVGTAPAGAARLSQFLDQEPGGCARVISVGLAAALQDSIESGDLVCDPSGCDADLPALMRSIALDQNIPIHFGRFFGADQVLTPAVKRRIGLTQRACAADMESAGLRRWAESRSTPFLALRAVIDAVDDELPADLPDGPGFSAALAYTASHWRDWPLLARLAVKRRKALSTLGLFLKELLPAL